MAEEMFKTTLMGGFDKDDVLAKVKNIKDEAYAEKSKLIKAGKEKDKKIKALQDQINQNNIRKAQELEAQEKAELIIQDAEQKRDMLMEEARVEAQKCLDAVQSEVDEKLAEGKRKYIAVQEEMNEIVQLINEAQKRFMSSYKEVHKIISTMPESMKELEDEEDKSAETDSLDESDDEISEKEWMQILEKEARDEE